jgi:hypothetical protein
MLTKTSLYRAALGLGLLVGCGSDDARPAAEDTPIQAALWEETFVAARPADEACRDESCAFVVKRLNCMTSGCVDTAVGRLDLSALELDETATATIRNAPAGTLVVRGRIGDLDEAGNRPFLATEAYLGLPGAKVDEGVRVYSAGATEPTDPCNAQSCPLWMRRLNEKEALATLHLTFEGVSVPGIDATWLRSRVRRHGALVAAVINREMSVVDVRQVFVKMPDPLGPCPVFRVRRCSEGQILTFSRSENRCLLPKGCVKPGACAEDVGDCATGYRMETWSTAPSACKVHVCDPLFSIENAHSAGAEDISYHEPSSGRGR